MKKVVLIDPCEEFLNDEKEIMESFNEVKCIAFTDSLKAREYLKNNTDVDLLITDYMMPNLTGLDVIKSVMQRKNEQIKFVVLSDENPKIMEELLKLNELDTIVRLEYKTNCWFLLTILE